jgi:cbb3-type cytochrome oxidase maturation protein
MDILYLLIPLSAVLVLGILAVFAWALDRGQFDDLERHGQEIVDRDDDGLIGIKPPDGTRPKNPA